MKKKDVTVITTQLLSFKKVRSLRLFLNTSCARRCLTHLQRGNFCWGISARPLVVSPLSRKGGRSHCMQVLSCCQERCCKGEPVLNTCFQRFISSTNTWKVSPFHENKADFDRLVWHQPCRLMPSKGRQQPLWPPGRRSVPAHRGEGAMLLQKLHLPSCLWAACPAAHAPAAHRSLQSSVQGKRLHPDSLLSHCQTGTWVRQHGKAAGQYLGLETMLT